MRKISKFAPVLLVVSGIASLHAQNIDSRVERSRIATEQSASEPAPATVEGALGTEEAAPPSPGDEDLGEQFVLKQQEKPTPFICFADLSGNYTDNAALQPHNGTKDTFFLAEVGANWLHPVAQNLALNVGVRQQLFRYDSSSYLDFEALNLSAGAIYALPDLGGIVLTAGYNYDRMVDRHWDEFFTNHMLGIGVGKTWSLSRAHSISAGYNSDFSFATDPSSQRRNYHTLSGSYNVDLTRYLSATAAYKLTLIDYPPIGRLDVNNMLILGFAYKVTPWCNAGVMGSYIFNNSDRSEFDYQVGNVSVTLGVNGRF